MKCPNILNINLSGKTILWIIIIVVNFAFLISASLKYNPFENFSNINGNNSFYDNFLKKLEFYSSNRRNPLINQVKPNYLHVINTHPKNNISDNVEDDTDSYVEPSLLNDTKSQPKTIHHHSENNNRNENEHHYNSHGILLGLVRNFFPRRHHERHHERHYERHHERHHFHI